MKKIDKPLYVHLGQQLKEARIRKGYSLQEVGDMIGKSKVSVKRYEDAVMRIDMDTLNLLCSVLDVHPTPLSISTGTDIEERIALTPNEVLPYEEDFLAALSDEMFSKFMELDENSKRVVLMILKMDNVDEIIRQLGDD